MALSFSGFVRKIESVAEKNWRSNNNLVLVYSGSIDGWFLTKQWQSF